MAVEAATPSTTAMITAHARGQHRLLHRQPWILDDPFALSLIGPAWHDLYEAMAAAFREELRHHGVAFIIVRSRYVEDRLLASGHRQYVILGAGLDSFAWRRPDLLAETVVIEVDHPATQAWKRQRGEELALPTHPNHRLAAVDFESGSLHEGLHSVGFDDKTPTVFSWLGVVEYLTVDAIEDVLRFVAALPRGSEMTLTYAPPIELLDEPGREFREIVTAIAADSGEPFRTLLGPVEAEELLVRCGLRVADHPTHDDLVGRYFAARSDELRPYTAERIITGVVASPNERDNR